MSADPSQRRRPTPQEVLDLKAGTDRGGRRRTWAEVVEMTGFSQTYLYRIATGTTGHQPFTVLVIDPREYDRLLGQMSDEDVLLWQVRPYCLCGCQQPTLQEHARDQRVPRGAFRLYLSSHYRRHPIHRQHFADSNKTPERVAAIRATKQATQVPAEDVLDALWRWKNAAPDRTMAQAAATARMSLSHLHNVGRQQFVTRLSAAKIYAAIGEPMTRDMARLYNRFLRNRHLPGPKPIISE